MQNIMLDLETMGNAPNAAIISIGACTFSLPGVPDEIPRKFYRAVSLQNCLEAGLSLSVDTLIWWLGQDIEARGSLRQTIMEGVGLGTALFDFTQWFEDVTWSQKYCIWSEGAAFDIPILQSAYKAIQTKVPWNYHYVRDTRTIYDLADLKKEDRLCSENLHNALADAIAQAANVIMAYNKIKGAKL